jgi:hypothetical protein
MPRVGPRLDVDGSRRELPHLDATAVAGFERTRLAVPAADGDAGSDDGSAVRSLDGDRERSVLGGRPGDHEHVRVAGTHAGPFAAPFEDLAGILGVVLSRDAHRVHGADGHLEPEAPRGIGRRRRRRPAGRERRHDGPRERSAGRALDDPREDPRVLEADLEGVVRVGDRHVVHHEEVPAPRVELLGPVHTDLPGPLGDAEGDRALPVRQPEDALPLRTERGHARSHERVAASIS